MADVPGHYQYPAGTTCGDPPGSCSVSLTKFKTGDRVTPTVGRDAGKVVQVAAVGLWPSGETAYRVDGPQTTTSWEWTTYAESDLRAAPEETPAPRFQPGDTVRLKCGSPPMTVYETRPEEGTVSVAWWSDRGPEMGDLPACALVKCQPQEVT